MLFNKQNQQGQSVSHLTTQCSRIANRPFLEIAYAFRNTLALNVVVLARNRLIVGRYTDCIHLLVDAGNVEDSI